MSETMRPLDDFPPAAESALDFDAALYEKWEKIPALAGVDILRHSPLWSAADAEIVAEAIIHCRRLFKNVPAKAEFSVALCDDAEIIALNRVWRGKNAATNVLSFPAPAGPARASHLGDIAIAYETTVREAMEARKPFRDHLAHLTVHGVLHLLGFDHNEEAEAEHMERFETDVLARLAVPDPYKEDDAQRAPLQNEAEATSDLTASAPGAR